MGEASPPPPASEPDTLRGELLDRLTTLVDDALGGSLYAANRLGNVLQDYAPSLVPALTERCARARTRKREQHE